MTNNHHYIVLCRVQQTAAVSTTDQGAAKVLGNSCKTTNGGNAEKQRIQN